MRVRPGVEIRSALVVVEGAASDRGAALSAECDAITRDHILNRVRLLERLDVDPPGVTNTGGVIRHVYQRSGCAEKLGWQRMQPPRRLTRFSSFAARSHETGAEKEAFAGARERHVQSAELFVQSVAIGRGVGLGKRSVVWDEAFLEPHHERRSPLSPLAVCIELRRTASSSPGARPSPRAVSSSHSASETSMHWASPRSRPSRRSRLVPSGWSSSHLR